MFCKGYIAAYYTWGADKTVTVFQLIGEKRNEEESM